MAMAMPAVPDPQDINTIAFGSKQKKAILTLALRHSLNKPHGKGSKYGAIADFVVGLAAGDYEDADYKTRMEAIKFLADRVEGKPIQQIDHSGHTTNTRIVLKWQESHIQPDSSDDPMTPLAIDTLDYKELTDGNDD